MVGFHFIIFTLGYIKSFYKLPPFWRKVFLNTEESRDLKGTSLSKARFFPQKAPFWGRNQEEHVDTKKTHDLLPVSMLDMFSFNFERDTRALTSKEPSFWDELLKLQGLKTSKPCK